MAHYRTTVTSPWSAEKAFAYLSDLRNFAEWDPGVSEAELIEGSAPGLGARYRVVANGATLEYVTKSFHPDTEVYVVARSTLLASKDRITIDPIGGDPSVGGCRVTYDARLELNGPLRLFDPLLGIAFRRIGAKADTGLKKHLDAD